MNQFTKSFTQQESIPRAGIEVAVGNVTGVCASIFPKLSGISLYMSKKVQSKALRLRKG